MEQMSLTELTTVAQALHRVFWEMDYAILAFYHTLAEQLGWFFTPLMRLVSLTGYKGLFLIVLSIGLIFVRKTRTTGICTLLALAIGALFTNLLIKNLVARPRPYDFHPNLRLWWDYVGAAMESDKSFPSGHMTAACAFSTAFVCVRGKKWIPVALAYVLLMGISRNYLIVHYPSDVLGGIIFGTMAGLLAWLLLRIMARLKIRHGKL